jgi:hypothetical protein
MIGNLGPVEERPRPSPPSLCSSSRLRAAFDRSVRFLAAERRFVVQLGRFRGEIESSLAEPLWQKLPGSR